MCESSSYGFLAGLTACWVTPATMENEEASAKCTAPICIDIYNSTVDRPPGRSVTMDTRSTVSLISASSFAISISISILAENPRTGKGILAVH